MTKRVPELETDHIDANSERQRRDVFNQDQRAQAKGIRVLARGRADEVASRKQGVKGVWVQDLGDGTMKRLIVRNGQLEVES